MVHRCASIAVQARACMGLRARTMHPLLPAPGAQPALNPCLRSTKCTAVQHLKQLNPALPVPFQDPPEEERVRRLSAHSRHLCPHHQHDHQQHQAVVAVAECTSGVSRAECK